MAKKASKFTEELFAVVLERVSSGETLKAIARSLGFEEAGFRWHVANNEELASRYARAREMQAESWADSIIEASDTPLIGTKVKEGKDGTETTTGDCVDRAKLMVDARKWLMAKQHPKAYGDKIETTLKGDPNAPLEISWGAKQDTPKKSG